ncbi:DUF5071 domain-containing protein [Chitinophaga sp. XS-30]|uniref:DUF5071 domain-containing protein n=1 Tax=Chitinophaga sp. XS-30 TaxID=2604421 RepID=UPI0011DD2240|nr:DUF5071 domain-containing protein [Chitinophaga sp. XS-30]QEH43310.1 DUF5071 domain-containing protein [Chitinophaga sp. XS-30]
MNQINFIPRYKDDHVAMQHLQEAAWDELIPHVDILLEWLQDFNWPDARAIAEKLSAHTNSIKGNIIKVLRSNDGLWKYWCINQLIYHSKEFIIDQDLVLELQRIIDNPSKEDKLEGVDEIAQETIERWRSV